ncbi:MAG: ABC transporter permease [Bifidobacteriaceae bacterium]|jgi:ABC-2 type transport system permease protein|nr:ABC transporter permease [Bifidobacteriaceae bacterium]
MTTAEAATQELYEPGHSRGLLDAFKHSFLLSLIVKKEVKVRYRGSFLGLFWTYLKPAVSFGVYYFFVGYALGQRSMPDFAIYLFSGQVIVHFFNESFRNTTRAIRNNAALVRKIYLPRELFILAAWRVAIVHFFPQLIILALIALMFGWVPSIMSIIAIITAILIISLFSIALGMTFATANVFFRDSENLVDLITSITTWFSPVIYHFSQIASIKGLPHWLMNVYYLNPITSAVDLFHYAFWHTALTPQQLTDQPVISQITPHIIEFSIISIVASLALLLIGQLIFRKFEGKFAQEL